MRLPGRGPVVALGVALVLGAVLSPLASSLPDGLEWALERLGAQLAEQRPPGNFAAPIAEYSLPGVRSSYLGGALAGLVGVLIVFGAGYWVASLLASKRRAGGGKP